MFKLRRGIPDDINDPAEEGRQWFSRHTFNDDGVGGSLYAGGLGVIVDSSPPEKHLLETRIYDANGKLKRTVRQQIDIIFNKY